MLEFCNQTIRLWKIRQWNSEDLLLLQKAWMDKNEYLDSSIWYFSKSNSLVQQGFHLRKTYQETNVSRVVSFDHVASKAIFRTLGFSHRFLQQKGLSWGIFLWQSVHGQSSEMAIKQTKHGRYKHFQRREIYIIYGTKTLQNSKKTKRGRKDYMSLPLELLISSTSPSSPSSSFEPLPESSSMGPLSTSTSSPSISASLAASESSSGFSLQ